MGSTRHRPYLSHPRTEVQFQILRFQRAAPAMMCQVAAEARRSLDEFIHNIQQHVLNVGVELLRRLGIYIL